MTFLPSYIIFVVIIVKGGKQSMSIINIKDFPDDLHRRAKSEAALEGISLKAIIIKALEEYLKKKKKGGK